MHVKALGVGLHTLEACPRGPEESTMQQHPNHSRTARLQPPIRNFSGCHEGILEGLRELHVLPALAGTLARARASAAATLELFDKVVPAHHADEEQELFVSVQRSCRDAREREEVRALVEQLTTEHRRIEALWARIRPAVVQIAAGKVHGEPFQDDVEGLVQLYADHAKHEEEVFLPLADRILGRDANHMAALDVALHLRHAPPPRSAYI
jgi:hypothetical protein